MNPPIFDQRLVASVDQDGHRSCTASTPGPAGVAELKLGNGAVISVDYLEPDQLVSIDFAPSTRRSVIAALIGEGRASELLADRRARGPVKRTAKKAGARKAPAKKAAAKKAAKKA